MVKKKQATANGLKPAVGGFSSGSRGPASGLTQDFERHLEAHDWSKAVRIWKKRSPGQGQSPATKRDALKQLIYEGRDHMQNGHHSQAAACYCKALVIDANNLDCLRNLAMIDLSAEKPQAALHLIDQALAIRTDVASLWSVKIQCLGSLGRDSEAKAAVDQACALGLERNALLLDLVTRLMKDQPDAAISIASSLLEQANHQATAELANLIGVCRQYACFDLEEQVDWWAAASQLEPSQIPSILLNLLPLAESLDDNVRLVELQRGYQAWCEQQCNENPLPDLELRRIEKRPIRIGIVSGDFCNHVVARFLLPLLEHLDRQHFELVCLSTRSRVDDDARKRFEAIADFDDIDPCQPRATAEKVRRHQLDLCIDAAGFTAYGASQAFAWRLATLQLNMIGYPGSTFVPNMDLLLSDPILAQEHSWMHPEELLAMDGLAYCMEKPDEAVEIAEQPPQEEHGFINFGILVNPYKFHRDTIKLWADVLKATPNSQMAIVRPECRSISFQNNILQEFARNGIPANRVIIVNNHGRKIHYLDCYNKIDVVLDSNPMTGGTSTYEAVLMGLPVITLSGPNYHQRISATVLHHAGLADCIATAAGEYVSIASRIAQDVGRLRQLRHQARQLRTAPGSLCDGAAYAQRFEKALLQAMERRDMLGEHWQTRLQTMLSGA